jgi:hypothetical protein
MGFWRRLFYGQEHTEPQTPPTPASRRDELYDRIIAEAEKNVTSWTGVSGTAGSAEVFDFKENIAVSTGPQPGIHQPRPGTAVVEVVGPNGLLAMDVFAVTEPAPSGPFKYGPIASTHVVVGDTNCGHQEFEFPLDGPHPVELPKHIKDKGELGGHTIKIWWSCE